MYPGQMTRHDADGAAARCAVPLPDRFQEQARCRPDLPALVWDDEEIHYGELRAMVDEARERLRRLAPDPARPVAVVGRKSPRAVALILAALVDRRPVLVPSAELGRDMLDRLFREADCQTVFHVDVDDVAPGTHAFLDPVHPDECADTCGADTALLLTTSGSTGPPKIVPLSWSAVDRFTQWAADRFAIEAGTTVLSYAPLNFDLCLLEIWSTLGQGGRVLLVDQERAASAEYLLELLVGHDVHVVQGVPMLHRLLVEGTRDEPRSFDGVRHVMTTGEAISVDTAEALASIFPSARIHNVYGATETNDSFIHEIDPRELAARRDIPIGEPIDGVRALVVGEDGSVVEGAGRGELWVATPFQSEGYLRSELNEDKFVLHDPGDGERVFYRTGDISCRHDDGSLSLEGRADCYVKVRGVRLHIEAVENIVAEYPGVVEVAVIAVPDEIAGQVLHAVVRQDPQSRVNGLALRKHCASNLERTAIPSSFHITTTPLPRTPSGKIDRRRSLAMQEETT